jgi:hypothetical protein
MTHRQKTADNEDRVSFYKSDFHPDFRLTIERSKDRIACILSETVLHDEGWKGWTYRGQLYSYCIAVESNGAHEALMTASYISANGRIEMQHRLSSEEVGILQSFLGDDLGYFGQATAIAASNLLGLGILSSLQEFAQKASRPHEAPPATSESVKKFLRQAGAHR